MMGDSLLGSIQGLFAFFILLVGILIGWFSNEKVKKEEKMKESDAYVRDHLLIQFMLLNYAPISFFEYDFLHKEYKCACKKYIKRQSCQ